MTRTGLWTSLFIVLLTLNVSTSMAGREESESEHGAHAEKEAHEAHGEADETPGVVTLDAEALAKSGIVAAPAASPAAKTERQITGTVLDSGELLELCRRYGAARERAPALLPALEENARVRWGKDMARALFSDASVCAELAPGHGALIEVTRPSDEQALPPTLRLERPADIAAPAQRLSLVEKAHSPVPVHAFFLVPAASAELVPGETVTLRYAAAPKHPRVRVPDSAVVWLDGKPWVYVEEGGGRFVRRELGSQGIAPDARVVVSGAQMLLSQEFRTQIHAGEEGEHEAGEAGEKK